MSISNPATHFTYVYIMTKYGSFQQHKSGLILTNQANNLIEYINRSNKKRKIIILIDAEKVFNMNS